LVVQFSDTVYEVAERRYGPALGILPFNAGVVPTNTRAVVLMSFNDSGVIKHLDVARFFDDPFINDYWYLIKKAGAEPLESIATLAEAVGMKVVGTDKDAGTFTLEDVGTKAKIAVKLEGQTMHLNSRNPHHRLAPEYRAFIKREYALTSNIIGSEVVQEMPTLLVRRRSFPSARHDRCNRNGFVFSRVIIPFASRSS